MEPGIDYGRLLTSPEARQPDIMGFPTEGRTATHQSCPKQLNLTDKSSELTQLTGNRGQSHVEFHCGDIIGESQWEISQAKKNLGFQQINY